MDIKLAFDEQLATNYKSASQKVRVLTEEWVDTFVFCPNCGYLDIGKYPNNEPVADFYCPNCREDYELKSKQGTIGKKIVDGAYRTMLERLASSNNPNFFLLNYNLQNYTVENFLVIPKHFFTPKIIEERKPLSPSARRAGWIGCNIVFKNIPQSGKIFFIRNREIQLREKVLQGWKKTLFLRGEKEMEEKGWLLDIMICIERIKNKEFSLDEVYKFENELAVKHPQNYHIKDKIRQQLQILRDRRYLNFTVRGNYKLI